MVAPCDKYRPWVRTNSGLTPSDSVGYIGSMFDLWDWQAVVEKFLSALTKLVAQRELVGTSSWPERLAGYDNRLEELTSFGAYMAPSTWQAEVEKMVTLALETACDVGVLEAELVELGTKPENPIPKEKPTPVSDPLAKAGGLGVGLLAIAALYLFTKDD